MYYERYLFIILHFLNSIWAYIRILISNQFITIFCYKNLNFPLCRRLSIISINLPFVNFINIKLVGTHINHWFDRKHHTGSHNHTSTRFRNIAYIRIFMELKTNTMPTDFFDNSVAILYSIHMYSMSHITEKPPRFYILKTNFNTFFCNIN